MIGVRDSSPPHKVDDTLALDGLLGHGGNAGIWPSKGTLGPQIYQASPCALVLVHFWLTPHAGLFDGFSSSQQIFWESLRLPCLGPVDDFWTWSSSCPSSSSLLVPNHYVL